MKKLVCDLCGKELDYTREALYKACNGNEYIADIFLKQARKEKFNDGR